MQKQPAGKGNLIIAHVKTGKEVLRQLLIPISLTLNCFHLIRGGNYICT